MCFNKRVMAGRLLGGVTSRDMAGVTLRNRLETQNLQTQRRQLAAAKIKYIISPTGWWWPPRDGQRADYSPTYPIVYSGPDLTVFRVY